MTKLTFYLVGIIAISFANCGTTKIPTNAVTFTNEQIVRLWDMAESKELVGTPQISYVEIFDSLTKQKIIQKISTQHFRLTILTDKGGHPIPPSSTQSLRRINRGTVYGTTTCSSSCKSIIAGGSCETKGCDAISGGCSSPQCGSNCYSYNCSKTSTGFGWGVILV